MCPFLIAFTHHAINRPPHARTPYTLSMNLSPSSMRITNTPTRRAILRAISLLPLSFLPQPVQSRCLSPGTAQSALSDPFPDIWPYAVTDFTRYDNTPDSDFYSEPRISRHIDDQAAEALKDYYASKLLPTANNVLDLCTSVESYIAPSTEFRVTGLGMNEVEMRRNTSLAAFALHDLNADPNLPYTDNSFDLVLCALSIDYLTHPRHVIREIGRVLRPGGQVAISFSDRVFATKAVSMWMAGGDLDHIYNVASFIHFAGGFSPAQVIDLSPRRWGTCTGDPLYVVLATKLQ